MKSGEACQATILVTPTRQKQSKQLLSAVVVELVSHCNTQEVGYETE